MGSAFCDAILWFQIETVLCVAKSDCHQNCILWIYCHERKFEVESIIKDKNDRNDFPSTAK